MGYIGLKQKTTYKELYHGHKRPSPGNKAQQKKKTEPGYALKSCIVFAGEKV